MDGTPASKPNKSALELRIRPRVLDNPSRRKHVADKRDTTVTKIDSRHSPKGPDGETYLASGKSIAMRMWQNEKPTKSKDASSRAYEVVGFVLKGKAELVIEGQTVLLEPGNSWVVPKGAKHTYRILETFTAIEATHPPFQVHGRDVE